MTALVSARHIVTRGEDEHGKPKVVLSDSDHEPAWWLDAEQALAVADRIREHVQQILKSPRELKRPAAVDEHFRSLEP